MTRESEIGEPHHSQSSTEGFWTRTSTLIRRTFIWENFGLPYDPMMTRIKVLYLKKELRYVGLNGRKEKSFH